MGFNIEGQVMTDTNIRKVSDFCRNNLTLADAKLSNEYYYNSLPLCVIDAVYSIGVKYTATQNVVERFCRYAQTGRYRPHGSAFPPTAEQLSIAEFLKLVGGQDFQSLAETVFGNKQRTSARSGILKAEATCAFATALQEVGVDYFQDIAKADLDALEQKIIQIPGQKSLKSFTYFLMLSGDDTRITPGRRVIRFLRECTGKIFAPDEAVSLVKDVAGALQADYPNLTVRGLDHEIWKHAADEIAA